MSTGNNFSKDSFYQGTVLLIIPITAGSDVWHILQILNIDTANDTNINTVFENPSFKLGSTIIQSTLVKRFDAGTKKIKRKFHVETGLEYWEAI